MQKFIIKGGSRLSGELTLQGSKNSSLPIMAAALLCGATACSDEKNENSAVSVSEQLRSYKAATIGMAEQFSKITTFGTGSAGAVLLFGELKTGGWSGFVTDGKFSDYKEFQFTPQSDETVTP